MEQQEQRTSVRLVVVDPDLEAQCDRVEEHLLAPLAEIVGGAGGHPLFADGLAVFRRVREALADAVARGPKVWSPNGRWEHEGLRIVELPTEDTDLLYALLRELSGLLVAPPDLPDPSGVVATVRTTVTSAKGSPLALICEAESMTSLTSFMSVRSSQDRARAQRGSRDCAPARTDRHKAAPPACRALAENNRASRSVD